MRALRYSVISVLSVCLLWMTSLVALAADPEPVAILKQTSSQLIRVLQANISRIRRDHTFVERQVRQIVVPHFSIEIMSRSVIGRNYWAKATPKQRHNFQREFTNLVIRTYSAPLSDYNGDRVNFYPYRGSIGKASRVVVRSIIIRPSGQRIPVNYRLVKTGSTWKVYDFSVEGISMVQSYRSQFSPVLQKQGMAGLVEKIRQNSFKS